MIRRVWNFATFTRPLIYFREHTPFKVPAPFKLIYLTFEVITRGVLIEMGHNFSYMLRNSTKNKSADLLIIRRRWKGNDLYTNVYKQFIYLSYNVKMTKNCLLFQRAITLSNFYKMQLEVNQNIYSSSQISSLN